MTKINDGGPITPTVAHIVFSQDESGRGLQTFHYTPGMSLRDYFAGQALTGLLAGRQPNNAYPLEYLAETSYATADAMIEARGE